MERIFRPRTIHSVYYIGNKVVRTNASVHANSAVLNCVNHMQLNHYGATHAEVYDTVNGVLHAVIKRSTGSGTITIVYKRDVKEGM